MRAETHEPTPPLPSRPLEDPRLLAYLPMLYVAWADGDLAAEEVRAICDRAQAELPDERCGELLGAWLDPGNPPAAADLQRLLAAIRRWGAGLGEDERPSLTRLGVEMARAGGREISAAEQRALTEVERALGVSDSEGARLLLFPERPPARPAEPAPPFDPAALTRLLDGEEAETRQRVRRLLSAPEFRYPPPEIDRGAYRELVLDWTRRLAAEGLGGLGYPRAYGGGDDLPAFMAAFETLAFHDLSLLVKFGVQFGLFAGSIAQLGSEEHHRRYLEAAIRLELPGCFAMTETGHGSNVADLETTARYDRDAEEFIVHTPHLGAGKDYIGNAAAHGRMATVFAQLEVEGEPHGVHAFLVPIRDGEGRPLAGVRIEDDGAKLGLNGVDNGRLWFDRVRIPRQNLLDRFAQVDAGGGYTSPIASPSRRFFTMLGTLVGGRVNVALAALSATKSALTIAVRYGARRRQFGPSGEPETVILDYLTHQRRLLPRIATAYALHFGLHHLAERYLASDAAGDDAERREVEAMAAGLKAFATWNATATIQTCREACGGQGYLAVNRFAALKADTDVFTTFEGDNTVLLQLAAKSLLTGFRKQFSEMNAVGLVRYVAVRAATVVTELNPVVTRLTSEEHLRDRDFHLGAFRWREEHLLSTLARRLKARIDAGKDPFEALVECQDHAVSLAKAHVERLVLERFAAAVEAAGEPSLAEVLGRLCDLFALWYIERDMAWFLEHGTLEAGKAKAIRKLNNKLLGEMRPLALPLVDAFGIPDALLAAPIAVG